MVAISDAPIDVAHVYSAIRAPHSGGIDIFVGTVRNHSGGKRIRRLEYAAYTPMAEKMMVRIEREIRELWTVDNVIMIHRIGLLEIGDVAVVTAVSAAHREEAFAACRYAIDRIKSIVPIWKKEFAEDGETWVEGAVERGTV
jgi:molybdopterin synthase catalytic subunit